MHAVLTRTGSFSLSLLGSIKPLVRLFFNDFFDFFDFFALFLVDEPGDTAGLDDIPVDVVNTGVGVGSIGVGVRGIGVSVRGTEVDIGGMGAGVGDIGTGVADIGMGVGDTTGIDEGAVAKRKCQ